MYIYNNISLISSRNKFSDKCCRENQNTQFRVQKPFPENRAVYEIMWKKYGTFGQARGDNMIRRMFTISCITKTNNTLRIGNTYCFPVTMDTWKNLNITLISPLPLLFFP
jgi:hypothetical protein